SGLQNVAPGSIDERPVALLRRAHTWRRGHLAGPLREPGRPFGPPRATLDGRLLEPSVGIHVEVILLGGADPVAPARMARLRHHPGVMAAARQYERHLRIEQQMELIN